MSVAVAQTAPAAHAVLRPHRLAIGCYDLVDGRLQRTDRIETDVVGDRTEIPELVGRKRAGPAAGQRRRPGLRQDPAGRALVRDRRRAPGPVRRLDAALAGAGRRVGHDPGRRVAGPSVRRARAARDRHRDRLDRAAAAARPDSRRPRGSTPAPSTAPRSSSQVSARPCSSWPASAEPGSDRQLQLALAFAATARTDEHAAVVRGLLDGTGALEGLSIDADMRWALLTSLVAAGAAGEDEIEAELDRDSHRQRPARRGVRAGCGADVRGEGRRLAQSSWTRATCPTPSRSRSSAGSPGCTTRAAAAVRRPLLRRDRAGLGHPHQRDRPADRVRALPDACWPTRRWSRRATRGSRRTRTPPRPCAGW